MANSRTIHTMYPIHIQGSPDVLIPGSKSITISPQIDTMMGATSGKVDPTYYSVKAKEGPSLSFSSEAIAICLSKIGIGGLVLTSSTGLEAYLQKMAFGGTRATSTNHIKVEVLNGMVIPKTLQAGHDTFATISYDVFAVTNDAGDLVIVMTDGVALPATTATEEGFVAGPVKVNNTTINSIQDISVDFGITAKMVGGSGLAAFNWVGISTRIPSMTFKTNDIPTLVSLFTNGSGGLYAGLSIGATTTKAWFRKCSQLGRVADATGQHVSAAVTEGIATITDISGDDILTATVNIKPTYDETNAVVQISTTATI